MNIRGPRRSPLPFWAPQSPTGRGTPKARMGRTSPARPLWLARGPGKGGVECEGAGGSGGGYSGGACPVSPGGAGRGGGRGGISRTQAPVAVTGAPAWQHGPANLAPACACWGPRLAPWAALGMQRPEVIRCDSLLTTQLPGLLTSQGELPQLPASAGAKGSRWRLSVWGSGLPLPSWPRRCLLEGSESSHSAHC